MAKKKWTVAVEWDDQRRLGNNLSIGHDFHSYEDAVHFVMTCRQNPTGRNTKITNIRYTETFGDIDEFLNWNWDQ